MRKETQKAPQHLVDTASTKKIEIGNEILN